MAIHVTREDVIRIAGSPITQNIVPAYPGQICLDMLSKECYIAYSVSSSSWQPLQSKLDINFNNLTADQVAYRNNDYPTDEIRTVREALDKLLYKNTVISHFKGTVDPLDDDSYKEYVLEFEIGKIIYENSLKLIWNCNKSNIAYQDIIAYSNGEVVNLNIHGLQLHEREYTIEPRINSDIKLSLRMGDGVTEDEKSLQIKFLRRGYWGTSKMPKDSKGNEDINSYNEEFVKNNLQIRNLIETRVRDITVDANKDEYIYYIIPKDLTTLNNERVIKFINNNFEGGFTFVCDRQLVNDFNYPIEYSIYRSDHPGLGKNTKISIR